MPAARCGRARTTSVSGVNAVVSRIVRGSADATADESARSQGLLGDISHLLGGLLG